MDLEAMLLGLTQARLTQQALTAASSAGREDRGMPNSTRRPFESRMAMDAATARAAAQNMEDGKAMVHTAQTFATTIRDHFKSIQEILQDCAYRDNLDQDFIAGANDSVKTHLEEIQRLAANAEFNGLKLMDGSAGNGGVVQLQAGNSPRDQKLVNFLNSALSPADADGVIGTDGSMNLDAATTGGALSFANQADAAAALAKVGKYIDHVRAIEAQYSYDYKSLDNLSLLFEEQADIFDDVIKRDQAAPAAGNASYLQTLLEEFGSASILSSST